MASRRGNTGRLVVILWRDIPAQVTAGGRADGAKVLLDARFQHAIDRAAAVAGATDTESYVAQWRRETEPLVGDPDAGARARARQLDDAFPQPVLERLVRSGGWQTEETP
ncbi:MAG: virulence factor [Actinomycetota bacterium]